MSDKKKSKKKLIIGLILGLLIVSFFVFAVIKSKNGDSKISGIVFIKEVVKQDIKSTVFTNGVIVSENSRITYSDVSGKIMEITVKKGIASVYHSDQVSLPELCSFMSYGLMKIVICFFLQFKFFF